MKRSESLRRMLGIFGKIYAAIGLFLVVFLFLVPEVWQMAVSRGVKGYVVGAAVLVCCSAVLKGEKPTTAGGKVLAVCCIFGAIVGLGLCICFALGIWNNFTVLAIYALAMLFLAAFSVFFGKLH